MAPIGIFDSGYGGLTVMKEIVNALPQYDFIYLGDNARSPYGPRSFETVHKYTLQAVNWFFDQGCSLVLLACNTASAKALRTIQQTDLPLITPEKKVLGVIRPVTEEIGKYSKTKHIGVFGTAGTIKSQSYSIEIAKFYPEIHITQEACPMWVPLVENGEFDCDGADYFVSKHINNILEADPLIDAIILGCTHYPLLMNKIRRFLPKHIQIISQAEIVANSLIDYLKRHPEIDLNCSKNAIQLFYTTDSEEIFNRQASMFFGKNIDAGRILLS